MGKINEAVDKHLLSTFQKEKSDSLVLEAVSGNLLKRDDLEDLCTNCGLCCHNKVIFPNGDCVVHPTLTCEFLGPDRRCTVYSRRFLKCDTCLNRDEMVAKDFVLPEGCPYTKLRDGYKPARVVTEEEFERLIALDSFYSALGL